ncbi:MAG: ACP S-malonyltransferase, partial [Candidatus Coatesbacteria bacterium]|nr:ACP S-malonyltransferase [Candidatus Coatesbacteria bacterium]
MNIAVCFPGAVSTAPSNTLDQLALNPIARPIVLEGLRYIESHDELASGRSIHWLQTYISGVACYEIIRETGPAISAITEHGTGFFAALVAAESVSFTNGLKMVRAACSILDSIAAQGEFDMASIIGLNRDEINGICSIAAESGEIYLANVNSPTQFVLSGHKKAVVAACDCAFNRGAIEAKLLNIGVPVHTNLLEWSSRHFLNQFGTHTFSNPEVMTIEHIYGQRVIAGSILDLLSQQLFMPVKWARV